MPSTKKTTKAVSEAPGVPNGYALCPNCKGTGEIFHVGETWTGPHRGKMGPCPDCGGTGKVKTRPRYTVELTTEGWQIKDNERGVLLADVYGSEWGADGEAHELNRQGR